MKNIFLLMISMSFFSFHFSNAQSIINSTILFESGKYFLTNEAETKLQSMYDSIKSFKIISVKILGHTDNVGNKNYNELLSENRANRVRQFFLDKNFDFNKIKIEAFDFRKPSENNSTENGKQKNRRVEIVIEYSKVRNGKSVGPTLLVENNKPESIEPKLNSLDDLFNQLATKPANFRIKTNRDTVLKGNDGTIINIKANAFQSKSGFINFSLQEDYSIDEMIADRLTTTSDGKHLVSSGMIKTAVTDDEGNQLQPFTDKALFVMMPTNLADEQVKLFDGIENKNAIINWKLNDKQLQNTKTYNYPKKQLMTDTKACNEEELLQLQNIIKKTTSGSSVIDNQFFKLTAPNLETERDIAVDCKSIKKYYAKYKVNNMKDLSAAVEKEQLAILFKEYGVDNVGALNKKIKEEKTFADVSYNVFNQSKLGMINCDKFWENTQPKIMQKTDVLMVENSQLFLIFKGMKLALASDYEKSKDAFRFSSIPQGMDMFLVGMKVENGKAYFGLREIKSSRNIESLTFHESNPDEIKKALSALR